METINHYNPTKYWKYRKRVVDCRSKKASLLKYFYLNYLKKSDAFNCDFISTYIGAGAVITHDIPSNCVVGGVPAKVLKEFNK